MENNTDPKAIAAYSALVAVAVSSGYFHQRVTKIEEDLADVKQHLASIVPHADPQLKNQVDNAIKAIQIIDGRVAETQKELKNFSSPTSYSDIKPYQRITRTRSKSSSDFGDRVVLLSTDDLDDSDDYLELSDDDDIAAMM